MKFGLISLFLAVLHQFRLVENFFSTMFFVPGLLVLHTKYKQVMSYVVISVQAMCIWLSRQLQALVFPLGIVVGWEYNTLKMHRSVLSRQAFSCYATQNINGISQIC